MKPNMLNLGRAIGALGSSIPAVGDIGTMAFIKKKAGTPVGIGARQGLKYAGGPIAVASWSYMAYQNRHLPGDVYNNMKLGYQMMAQHQEDISRSDRTLVRSGGRGRGTSQTRDGPPSLSQRTRKSPSFGKKRRRCKHRNKAGKRCLRPAGHSGRHRYQ